MDDKAAACFRNNRREASLSLVMVLDLQICFMI